MTLRFRTLAATALLFLCTSCRGGGVSLPETEVSFSIDIPAGISTQMVRMLYFSNGSAAGAGTIPCSIENGGTAAGTQALREGSYRVFAYNFDIPDTFLAGESSERTLRFHTAEVSENILRRCGLSGAEARAFHSPDRVACGRRDALTPAASGQNACVIGTEEVTLPCTLDLKVDGIEYVADAGIMLCGVPVIYAPYSADRLTGRLWSGLSKGKDGIRGSFNIFRGGTALPVSATVSIIDTAGKAYIFELDCTEAAAAASGVLNISSPNSIVVPKPENSGEPGGGGFNPELGEWNHQQGDIYI